MLTKEQFQTASMQFAFAMTAASKLPTQDERLAAWRKAKDDCIAAGVNPASVGRN